MLTQAEKTTNTRSLTVTFNIDPVPASRPRVSRFGTYYGKRYKAWLTAAPAQLPRRLPRFSGPVHVEVYVACARPKKTKLTHPRGDCDNFAKGPLDALTKAGVWNDDGQVVRLLVEKRWADRKGCTIVRIHELEQTPANGRSTS